MIIIFMCVKQVNSISTMLVKLQNLMAHGVKLKSKLLQGRQVDVSVASEGVAKGLQHTVVRLALVRPPNAMLTTSGISKVGETQRLPRRQY